MVIGDPEENIGNRMVLTYDCDIFVDQEAQDLNFKVVLVI
jgi:hypothetical protein